MRYKENELLRGETWGHRTFRVFYTLNNFVLSRSGKCVHTLHAKALVLSRFVVEFLSLSKEREREKEKEERA